MKGPIYIGSTAQLSKAINEGVFTVIVPRSVQVSQVDVQDNALIVAKNNTNYKTLIAEFNKLDLHPSQYKILQIVEGTSEVQRMLIGRILSRQ